MSAAALEVLRRYPRDPEKVREKRRRHRAKHRDAIREYMRRYRAANLGKGRRYYYPEYQRESRARYAAAYSFCKDMGWLPQEGSYLDKRLAAYAFCKDLGLFEGFGGLEEQNTPPTTEASSELR